MTRPEFFSYAGNYSNKTSRWLLVLGTSGTYSVLDGNGNTAANMSSGIPYAIVPPLYSLSGGTSFYGILLEFEDLKGWL